MSVKNIVKQSIISVLEEDDGYQTYNPSVQNGEPDYEAIKKAAVDGTPNVKQSVEAAINDDKETFDRAALNLSPCKDENVKDHEPLENLIIMCGLASEDMDDERVDTILEGLYEVLRNYADDLKQIVDNTNKEDDENENIRQVEKEKEEMYENQNVSEHHKHSREEKQEFIRKNYNKAYQKGLNVKTLDYMDDEEIDSLYQDIESKLGINEQPDSTNVAPLDKMNQPVGTNQNTKLNEIRDDDVHEKEVYHNLDYDINLYKSDGDNIYKIDAKPYSDTKFQDIHEAMNALSEIMKKNDDIKDIINNIEPNKDNIIDFNGTEFNMEEFNKNIGLNENEEKNNNQKKQELVDVFTKFYNDEYTVEEVIEELNKIESEVESNNSFMFIRFGDSPGLYTISEIVSDLKNKSHQNYEFLMDQIKNDAVENDNLDVTIEDLGSEEDEEEPIDEGHDENTWGNDERMWQETYFNSYEDKKEKTQTDRLYGSDKNKKGKKSKMEQKKLSEIKKEKDTHKNLKEVFNLIEELNNITEVNDILMESSKERGHESFYNDAKSKINELNNKLKQLKEAATEETNDATAYNMANVPAQRYLNQVQDYNEKYETEYMDERLDHIEDSQKTEQDEAYEEKKRQLEDEDEEYIDTTRGRDTLDFDYDSEPPEEYKDRVKREVETGRSEEKTQEELDSEANIGGDDPYGDDGTRSDVGKEKYDTAQKRKEIDDNKPMYNKDQQPVEDEEEYEEDKEERTRDGDALKETYDRFYSILNYQGNKPNSKSRRDNVNEDFKHSYKETKLLFKNSNKVALNEIKNQVNNKKVEVDQNGPIIKINGRVVSEGYNANHILGKAEALCERYDNELSDEEAIAHIMSNGKITD